MAPEKTLTDYESRRLENIRRNGEMMAALMLQSKASDLSSSLKRTGSKSSSSLSETKKIKISPPRSPIVIRRSLRTRGLPPNHSGNPLTPTDSLTIPSSQKPTFPPPRKRNQIHITDAFVTDSDTSDRPLIDAVLSAAAAEGDGSSKSNPMEDCEFDPRHSMLLVPKNVAKVVPDRILSVQFLPSANRTVVVAGNKLGNVGFWDLDFEGDQKDGGGTGVYVYTPHSAPVSALSFHPSSMNQMLTGSYDGLIRRMDFEKETFNVMYSTKNCIFSICQWPRDFNSLFIGEGAGVLKLYDERAGKDSVEWDLHEDRINTIDFSPENCHLMATSSTDGTACIWDVRSVAKHQPEPLYVVRHKRSVHSAYFSPTGSYLATTSLDDRVGIISLSQFKDASMIHHNNRTGRWLSTFRAIWGWDDSFVFLGNMRRAVDVISMASKMTVALESPEMTTIPCRLAAHPRKVGTLACASRGGQVYLWTESVN